jgi:hypothetical protein
MPGVVTIAAPGASPESHFDLWPCAADLHRLLRRAAVADEHQGWRDCGSRTAAGEIRRRHRPGRDLDVDRHGVMSERR